MGVFLLWLPEHLQSSDLLSAPAISPECLMAHSAFMIPMDPYHNARKYTRFLSFLEVTPLSYLRFFHPISFKIH